jgi:hypothetical protein
MKSFSILKNKIKTRIFNKGYGFHNYPNSLKYIKNLNKRKNKKNLEIQLHTKDVSYTKKIEIHIASKKIIKSPISFWKSIQFLNDCEDVASAHRWIWAYKLLDSEIYTKKEKIVSLNCLINNWFYFFDSKTIDKEDVINESYTISERLANYVILSKLGFIKKNNLHTNSLNKQLEHLTENLEFYYKKKSNHLLNNIRAIIIYSNYTKQPHYIKFANKILYKLIKDFIDKDGFFKFCSSHYQFIFTKWMSDIFLFAPTNKFFKSIYLLNLNACNFFIVNDNNKIRIPLFGNVSPDIEPKFITKLIFNIINKRHDKFNKNIFSNKYIKLFSKKKLNINIKKISNNNEWSKLINKKIIIYTRNPGINGFNFNHSHNDYFHFICFYLKKPIFIDSGRKSYFRKDEIYKFSKFHNSFLINDNNPLDKLVDVNNIANILFDINFKYKTNISSNNLVLIGSNKLFSFERTIKANGNSVIIYNNLNVNKNKDISFNLYLDNDAKLKKNRNECEIISNNKKILVKFLSKEKLILKTTILKNIKNFEKYGDKIKHQKINLCFKNTNKINLKIKMMLK